MKHFLTLALVVTSLFAHSQKKDHPDGEIKGTVTDQNGSPVSAATVYAVPQDATFDGITPRSIETDRNGGFDFRGGFQLGSYKLYSRKDADAYPDRSDVFYADSKAEAPHVDLTEDHPSATVTLLLGERAGVLVGKVIDVDTGAAVKAKLVFMDEDGNDHLCFGQWQIPRTPTAGKGRDPDGNGHVTRLSPAIASCSVAA